MTAGKYNGEAVCCDINGRPSYTASATGGTLAAFPVRLRPHRADGDDVHHDPLEVRKAALASILNAAPGQRLRITLIMRTARWCSKAYKLGLEGIARRAR